MSAARIALVAACVAAPAFLASGYVPSLVLSAGSPVTIAWPGGATITYKHNTLTASGPSNVEAGSDPVGAVDAAIATIGAATGLTFTSGSATATASAGSDGTNLVTFASTATNISLVGGATAVEVYFYSTGTYAITETDMVFNPAVLFSTLGTATRQDIQSVATHEAGHGVGLNHSPVMGSTMYPTISAGSTRARTLARDDTAGLRSLYTAAPAGVVGTVTGTLQRSPGSPSAGGHVYLRDSVSGRVMAGAVSLSTGAFTIAGVPVGHYELVAEPLDGPFTSGNLGSSYWGSVTFDTTFRTTVLGGASTPTPVVVKAGATTSVGAFTVAGPAPTLNLVAAFPMSTATGGFSYSTANPVIVTPPYSLWIGIVGTAVNTTSDSAFGFDSPFISITGPSTQSGTVSTYGYKIFPISVAAATPPGSYVIRMTDPGTGEMATAPGLLEVAAPATPLAYAVNYAAECPGPGGSVTFAGTSAPSLGNSAFALTLSGMTPSEVAIFLISTGADSFPVLGCTVSIDYAGLIFPFPGFLIPPAGSTATLPLPIPAYAPLAGVTIYGQAGAIDPGPSTLRISRALAIHFE